MNKIQPFFGVVDTASKDIHAARIERHVIDNEATRMRSVNMDVEVTDLAVMDLNNFLKFRPILLDYKDLHYKKENKSCSCLNCIVAEELLTGIEQIMKIVQSR